MNEKKLQRWRVYFTALVLFAELAHLAWEHFNGGVLSHNILNRQDLPAISNLWGLLLLPTLAWFLSGLSLRRIAVQSGTKATTGSPLASVVVGFTGSLLFGALLAGSFAKGYANVTLYLFQGMFVLALLLRVYRAECLLGFVPGMTFTFGAVLPTAIGAIFVALSAVAHLVVYPLLVHGWVWLKRRFLPAP